MPDNSNLPAVQVAAPSSQAVSVWSSISGFEQAQRMAGALIASGLVPDSYKNNVGGALVALDIAQRINASPLMVMQNLNIIEGRPSWGSSFIIAALNACGKFSPLRFRIVDRGERSVSYTAWVGPKGERRQETRTMKVRDKACIAHTIEKATGEVLEGPEVSVEMAVAEGWYTKPGSKWVTMPDLMLRYRAAAFFGRLYAPDLLMGFPAADEVADLHDVEYAVVSPAAAPAAPVAAEPAKKGRSKGVQAAMSAGTAQPAPVAAKPDETVIDADFRDAGDSATVRDESGELVGDDDDGQDVI